MLIRMHTLKVRAKGFKTVLRAFKNGRPPANCYRPGAFQRPRVPPPAALFTVQFRSSFGAVLRQFLGQVLGQFRGSFGVVLEQFRGSFGAVLEQFRGSFGSYGGATAAAAGDSRQCVIGAAQCGSNWQGRRTCRSQCFSLVFIRFSFSFSASSVKFQLIRSMIIEHLAS